MEILRIQNLAFSYKRNAEKVIFDFNYSFQKGRIYSIIGHNGAGKTTLIRLCLNILKKQAGEIIWQGDPNISYVPDLGGLYEYLTVKENVEISYKLYNKDISKINEDMNLYLTKWGLQEKIDTKVKTLSMGQKQRLSLIVATINKPDIIFLDEPSNSVDIVSQKMLKEYLTLLKKDNKTIIMATHDINLIENVCDEIIILNQGKIRFSGTMDSIEDFATLYKESTEGGS